MVCYVIIFVHKYIRMLVCLFFSGKKIYSNICVIFLIHYKYIRMFVRIGYSTSVSLCFLLPSSPNHGKVPRNKGKIGQYFSKKGKISMKSSVKGRPKTFFTFDLKVFGALHFFWEFYHGVSCM